MEKALYLKNKKYISAKRAAEITGYSSDYIGQLCRGKKIDATLVGRSWYVCEEDLLHHKDTHLSPYAKKPKKIISKKKFSKKTSKRTGSSSKKISRNIILEEEIAQEKNVVFSKPIETSRIETVSVAKVDLPKTDVVYVRDDAPLFPELKRNFDPVSAKAVLLKTVEDKVSKPQISATYFDKFIKVSSALIVTTILVVVASHLNFANLSNFVSNAGKNISSSYSPFVDTVSEKIPDAPKVNIDNTKLVASASDSFGWGKLSSWAKDTAQKMIAPWLLEKKTPNFIVQNADTGLPRVALAPQSGSSIYYRSTYVAGVDREYVDMKIDELKQYFLTSPYAPNVNRYYISKQNDVIVDRISRTSGSGSTVSVSSFDDLTDTLFTGVAYGDVVMYNGSAWVNVATSSLGITGTSYGQTFEVNALGYLAPTTTITTLLNGGFVAQASSTIVGDAAITGNLRLSGLSQGFAYIGSTGKVNSIASSSVNLSWFNNDAGFVTSAGAFPFTSQVGYNSTSTTLGLLNGFFSTASSTISGQLNLPSVALNSILSTDASGNVVATSVPTFGYFNATSTAATSTIAGGLAIEGSGFVYDYSTNNVGIGTSAPNKRLEVRDSNGEPLRLSKNATQYLEFFTGSTNAMSFAGGGNFDFRENGNTFVTFTGTQRVGIGTTTPTNKLTVFDSAASQLTLSAGAGIAQWAFRNAGGNLYLSTTTVAGTATTSTSALTILNNGNVGIGTNNPLDNLSFGSANATSTISINTPTGSGAAGSNLVIKAGSVTSGGGNYYTPGGSLYLSTGITSQGALTGIYFQTSGLYSGAPSGTTSPTTKMVLIDDTNGGANLGLGSTSPVSSFVLAQPSLYQPIGAQFNTVFGNGINSYPVVGVSINPLMNNSPWNVNDFTALQVQGRTSFTATNAYGIKVAAPTGTITNSYAGVFTGGNVGIGTTSPYAKLSVVGDGVFTSNLSTANFTATGTATFSGLSQGFAYLGTGGRLNTTASSSINLSWFNNDAGFITSSSIFGKAWEINSQGYLAPTTTITTLFNNGFLATASSTIVGSATTTGDFAAGNTLFVKQGGNVGIGTTNPLYAKLSVEGDIGLGNGYVLTSTADLSNYIKPYETGTGRMVFRTQGVDRVSVLYGGNVGIGTTSPYAKLSVVGDAAITGNMRVAGLTATGTVQLTNYTSGALAADATGALYTFSTSTWTFASSTLLSDNNTWSARQNFNGNASTTGLTVTGSTYLATTGGNVGIGTTNPTSSLTIQAGSGATPFTIASTSGETMMSLSPTGVLTLVASSTYKSTLTIDNVFTNRPRFSATDAVVFSPQLHVVDSNFALYQSGGQGQIDAFNGLNFSTGSGQQVRLKITTDGNVGVGTTTPSYTLTVASTTGSQLSLSAGAGIAQWAFRNAGGNFYLSTTTVAGTATSSLAALSINGTTGALSLGTTTAGTLKTTSAGLVWVDTTGGTAASSTLLGDSNTFTNTNNFTTKLAVGSSTPWGLLSVNANGLAAGTPQFVVGSSTATNFIVANNGNVGIGTSDPKRKLDIVGSATDGDANGAMISLYDDQGYSGARRFVLQNSYSTARGNNALHINVDNDAGTSLTKLFTFTSGGNMGVGTTSPYAKLSVVGDAAITNNLRVAGLVATGTVQFNNYTSGALATDATGALYTFSTSTWTFASSTLLGDSNTFTGVNRFNFSSTTYASFTTASTTNLIVNGEAFTDLTGTGLSLSGGALTNAGLLSITHTSGSAQTGAITLATSTTAINNDWGITNSGGTFTFNIPSASATVRGLLSAADYTTFNSKLSSYDAWSHPASGKSATTSEIQITGGLLSTASTTLSSDLRLSALTQGFAYIGSTGKVNSIASSSINLSWFNNDSGFTSYAWPFTANTGYVSTSTTLGLQNGFFSTASSTISSSFFLPSLSQGYSYLGTNGLVQTVSTSTLASQIFSATTFSPNSIITSNASGNLIATGTQLTVGNLIATTSASSYFMGNVGIGTTSPSQKLAVEGTIMSSASYPAVFFNGTGGSGRNWKILNNLGDDLGIYTDNDTWASQSAKLIILRSGNVGIGTTTPTNKLTITDTAASQLSLSAGAGISQWAFRNAGGNFYLSTTTVAGTATSSLAALSINGTTGALSLGTTTAGTLRVTSSGMVWADTTGGTAASSTLLGDSNTFSGTNIFSGTLRLSSVALNSLISTDASGNVVATSVPTFGYFNATSTAATSTIAGGLTVAGSSGLNVLQNGKVGIGTAAPATNLDVNGQIWTVAAGSSARNNSYDLAGGHIAAGSSIYSYGAICTGNNNGYCTSTSGVTISPTATVGNPNVAISGSGASYFNAGNLGVGTTSPFAQLSVGMASTTPALAIGVAGSSTPSLFVASANNNGYVGIGTASPSKSLDVAGDIHIRSSAETISAPTSVTIDTGNKGLYLGYDAANNKGLIRSVIWGNAYTPLYFQGSEFRFSSGPTSLTERMVIDSSGNMGIGTTSPYRTLSVGGSGVFTGGDVLASTFTATSSITTPSLTLSSVAVNSILSTNSSGVITATSAPTFGYFNATSTAATSTIAGGLAIEGSGFVYDYSTNNVGIGTASPNGSLHVYNSANTTALRVDQNAGSRFLIFGSEGLVNNSTLTVGDSAWNIQSDLYVKAYGNRPVLTLKGAAGQSGNYINVSSSGSTGDVFAINSSGYTGVASTTPWGLLSVNANGLASGAPQFVVGSSTATNFIVANNGNVGVGTAAPSYKLDVNGVANASYLRAANWVSTTRIDALTGSTITLYQSDDSSLATLIAGGAQFSGSVGIGTTSPYRTLSVGGSGVFTGGDVLASTFTATSSITTPSLTLSSVAVNSILSTNSSGVITATSAPTFGYFNATSTAATSTIAGGLAIEGSGFVYDYSTNNVGIGTAGPTKALDVVGTIRASGNSDSIGQGGFALGTVADGDYINLRRTTTGNNFAIDMYNGSWINTMTVLNSNGYIGIGTTTPAFKLDVYGAAGVASSIRTHAASTGGVLIGYGGNDIQGRTSADQNGNLILNPYGGNIGVASTSPWGLLSVNANALSAGVPQFVVGSSTATNLIVANSGNVGIGTVSPTDAKLQVVGAAVASEIVPLVIQNNDASAGAATRFVMAATTNVASNANGRVDFLATRQTDASMDLNLLLSPGAAAGPVSRLYIDGSTGNVGIGTTSPYRTLSVVGSGVFTGGDVLASTFTATSSITTPSLTLSSVAVNSILSTNSSGVITATSAPTFGYFNATSTAATSTIAGGLAIEGSGFVYDYSSNNVGIGTAAPTQKLDINGDLNVGGQDIYLNGNRRITDSFSANYSMISPQNNNLIIYNGANNQRFQVYDSSGNKYVDLYSDGTAAQISSGGTTNLSLQPSAGNVGIGTTGPNGKLEVAGAGIFNGTSVRPGAGASGKGVYLAGADYDGIIYYGGVTGYSLWFDGTNYKTGTDGGSNGGAMVQAANGSDQLNFYTVASNGTSQQTITPTNLAANNLRMVITNAGNVGIGTTNPTQKLELADGSGFKGASNIIMGGGTTLPTWSGNVELNNEAGVGFHFRGLNFQVDAGPTTGSPAHPTYVGALAVNSSGNTTLTGNLTVQGTGNTTIAGNVGISTTTPQYLLNLVNANTPQLSLGVGAGIAQWTLRNAGGNFYLSTTTVAGTATTSIAALEISGSGFGTTTLRGLNISGQATSTSNVGFNITTGCYAVNGTCVSGGGSGASTTLLGDFNTFTNTNNFTTKLAVGSSSPWGMFSVNANGLAAGTPQFVVGSSTKTNFIIDNAGRTAIGSSTATNAALTLQGAAGLDILRVASSTGFPVLTISEWGGFVQKVSSSTALSIQMASGTPVFEVDTTQSNTNAGLDITAATGQTSNLLNFYSSAGTFLSGYTASGGLFMNISSTTAINVYNGGGTAAFVVNSASQSVGIGTSTLTYNLNVSGSQTTSYIARINNADTANTADGLLITLGVANASRGTGNYFIGFADGSQTVAGKIQGGASAVAYTTTAADIAEFFRVGNLEDKPVPGEIVMLDTTRERTVSRADASSLQDNEPLGIVSTNPGFIGNAPICLVGDEKCDTEYQKYNVLVALAGQVPLKVTDENGVIVPGDYLTLSSTTPGTAVKMTDGGYIVGVALTRASTTIVMNTGTTTSTTTQKFVIANVKSGWREPTSMLAASSTDNIIPKRFASLFDFFKKIGLEVGQNFIKIANLVTEKIVANRVETKELCIDEVCVNKDQLQALILQSNVQVNSGNAGSLPNATSTDPNVTDGQATTTPAVGTGTTTPVTTDTSTTTPSTSTSTPVVDSGTQSTSSSTPSASPADTVSNTDSTSTSTSPVSDAGNNGPTI